MILRSIQVIVPIIFANFHNIQLVWLQITDLKVMAQYQISFFFLIREISLKKRKVQSSTQEVYKKGI